VPLEDRKDGLAGKHVAAWAVDVHPQLFDVTKGLELLAKLLRGHFVAPPARFANLAVKQQLADLRIICPSSKFPKVTSPHYRTPFPPHSASSRRRSRGSLLHLHTRPAPPTPALR